MKRDIVNGYISCGDCLTLMKSLPDESIDLIVTSPPYDNLRTYNGYSFEFEGIARELFRITKQGGVVVWVVNDAVVKGSETGSSFRQALYFKEIGFNLHDTMIWAKDTLSFPCSTRYGNAFEYMFVFSKGKPKTVNKICDRKNKWCGTKIHGTSRSSDGETFRKSNHNKTTVSEYGERFNVWNIPTEKNNKTGHPAVFPISIARDHIISWSNPNDVVLDPFMGSGTTAIASLRENRRFIGFEISEEYFEKAYQRIIGDKQNIDIFDIL